MILHRRQALTAFHIVHISVPTDADAIPIPIPRYNYPMINQDVLLLFIIKIQGQSTELMVV